VYCDFAAQTLLQKTNPGLVLYQFGLYKRFWWHQFKWANAV